jgi:mannosyltransferase
MASDEGLAARAAAADAGSGDPGSGGESSDAPPPAMREPSQEPTAVRPTRILPLVRPGTQGEPSAEQQAIWQRRYWVLLVAVTLVAAFLRLHRLGDWSLWIDEAHTLRDARTPDLGLQDRYPLSYLMLRYLLPLLPGENEVWLRLPFAAFGILSVPLLALCVRKMLGMGPALYAAAILALSPWHIFWSQNCRFYSMAFCFGLLAASLFYLGMEWNRLSVLLLSFVCSGVAALCHPSSALLLAAFGLYLLGLRWIPARPAGYRRGILIPMFAIMGAGAIWAVYQFLPNLERWEEIHGGDFSLMHLVKTTVHHVRIVVLVAATGGVFWLLRVRSRAGLFLGLWVLVPLLGLLLASMWVRTTAQYYFYALPAYCALAGLGTHVVTQRIQTRGLGGQMVRVLPLAMVLLDMVGYDYLYFQVQHGDRPQWREAALYIANKPTRGDQVVLTINGPSLSYYLGDSKTVVQITGWKLNPENPAEVPLLRRYVDQKITGSVWVVITEEEFREMDRSRVWLSYLWEHWKVQTTFRNWTLGKDMIVHVFRRDPGDR